MTSSTTERRVYAIPFPTLDELTEQILTPLGKTIGVFEKVSLDLRNVAGEIETTYVEVSLSEPPTLENLGTLAVFMDSLETEIDHLQDCAKDLRGAWAELEALREDRCTRADHAGVHDTKQTLAEIARRTLAMVDEIDDA